MAFARYNDESGIEEIDDKKEDEYHLNKYFNDRLNKLKIICYFKDKDKNTIDEYTPFDIYENPDIEGIYLPFYVDDRYNTFIITDEPIINNLEIQLPMEQAKLLTSITMRVER